MTSPAPLPRPSLLRWILAALAAAIVGPLASPLLWMWLLVGFARGEGIGEIGQFTVLAAGIALFAGFVPALVGSTAGLVIVALARSFMLRASGWVWLLFGAFLGLIAAFVITQSERADELLSQPSPYLLFAIAVSGAASALAARWVLLRPGAGRLGKTVL